MIVDLLLTAVAQAHYIVLGLWLLVILSIIAYFLSYPDSEERFWAILLSVTCFSTAVISTLTLWMIGALR